MRDFPLLVRLNKDAFDFTQARASGEDIRFALRDGQRLAYQIEQWDPQAGTASVWLRIPEIGGDSLQEIHVYWGNSDATSESDGKAVFNASNGYLSVWHMNNPVEDSVGTLPSDDTGTTGTVGMVGEARHLAGQKGVFGGDKIANFPSGASSHTTEAWIRAERSNATIIGWGNEGGGRGSKVRMQLRSPPHLHIDSDFSDVKGKQPLSIGKWLHVAHTYDRGEGRIYINGDLDNHATPTLNIKSPGRLWIGGWYHNYDFVGDLDEVRVSQVARTPEWMKLQFENQKPNQTVTGHIIQSASAISLSHQQIELREGTSVTVSANPGDAYKVLWELTGDDGTKSVVTDRFNYVLSAGRSVGNRRMTLRFKALFLNSIVEKEVPITIVEDLPEPVLSLNAPGDWNGRDTVEVVPQITNLADMQEKGVGELQYQWQIDDVAVIKRVESDRLVLKRAQGNGPMKVTVAISNGGDPTMGSASILVKQPSSSDWLSRESSGEEMPVDNQFIARDEKGTGSLQCRGKLEPGLAAQGVFLRAFADDVHYQTVSQDIALDRKYALELRIKPGMVKYRIEFGSKNGESESILYRASNLICGDAFIINGQSNAEATDVGPTDPSFTSDWIRSFGCTGSNPENARKPVWSNAVVRDRNAGKAQIGYWGMELAKRLVENHKVPICILNGAVGGSRIDQHQRNESNPTDVSTIYGRLLWRVQQAKLTHGIRGVLWHQGENDQGADGPTGGYGWQRYRDLFVDLSGAWKQDFPNIQHYYVFQIWPKACSMGVDGSDNQLREVQRSLANSFSNLSLMSTLGIKPPGGCHYPIEGYAEMARLICPLVERDHYQVQSGASILAPNLRCASFLTDKRDEVAIEFDSEVSWSSTLASEFYFDGNANQIETGRAEGNRLLLKLKVPLSATTISYLDSKAWRQDNLLYGKNGIAALTFSNVRIEAAK